MIRSSTSNNKLLLDLVPAIIITSSLCFISRRLFICHGLGQNPNEVLIIYLILLKSKSFKLLLETSYHYKEYLLLESFNSSSTILLL